MYQLLVDIHNYRQLYKISRSTMLALQSDLGVIARLVGAELRELAQGRSLVGFAIHRPSDTAFVVDSVFRIYDFLVEHDGDHNGFSLILESGNDDEEGLRQLRQLLNCATENQCLWLGPRAAAALAPYIYLEHKSLLWKALSRNSSQTPDLNITEDLLERFCPRSELEAVVDGLLGRRPEGTSVVCVGGAPTDAVGDMINNLVNRRLGDEHKRSFLWLDGQNPLDPAPIALTRSLFPQAEADILDGLDEAERTRWRAVGSFMFQNAHSCIPEVTPARISLEYPKELFAGAWRLYVLSLCRRLNRLGLPLFVHVENYADFNADSRALIAETIEWCAATTGLRCVVFYSSAELAELDDVAAGAETMEVGPLAWDELEDLGVRAESLPAALAFCRKLHRLGRRQAANVAFLSSRLAGVHEADDQAALYTQKSQIDRALLKYLLLNCDELNREVYYAIVTTYGLLPVAVLFEFLSYMAVERIRHPSIIQNLYRYGLIRDEELVVPAYPNCAEILEEVLQDRAARIRGDLETFLSQRLAKGQLNFRLDVFILMAEIASPEHFFEICFNFAEELLNVRNFETAGYVLDYASTQLLQLDESAQKSRLLYAVSYLNCRSLMLQGRTGELQVAISHLNQLPELGDHWIGAYVQLQRARYHFAQADIEQALMAVKRAVMQFQDANDRRGLASAHILFGQILLAKERLIEARDYFILARNNATSVSAVYEDVHAGFYDIVVTFLLGYHSRAIEALDDPQGILELARSNGLFSHVTYLEFLRGRVWFELGAYHDAGAAFERALELARTYPNPAAALMIRRWMGRAKVYLQDFAGAEPILSADADNVETRLFMAESKLLQSAHAEALVILNGGGFAAEGERRLMAENIDWSSGFANLEGKVFLAHNQQDCFANLASCYRAFCLAKTAPAGNDAVDLLYSFTRNQRRSPIDPYNYLYYFLYCQVLRGAGEGGIDDFATILGKSVKFIQERSSRIEDPGHKQSFLRNAHWSRLLLQDARGHNLA